MRKLFSAFFIAALFCAHAIAQEQYSKANALYRDGKFEEAIPLYSELAQKNPANPYYHYNLGNTYFKTNRFGRAVASYYKAFELLPRDSDIRYNLSLALKRSGETLVPAGVPEVLHRVYYLFSKNELSGLFWLLIWAAGIFGSARLLYEKFRRETFAIAVFAAAAAAIFGGWLLARNAGNPLAAVVESVAEVRNGPGNNFSAAATVPEGHTVELLGEKEDWYEVGIKSEGIKGWAKKSSLEAI